MNFKPVTVAEATKKIEHFCAYQERCHKEVVLRLKEMRLIPDVIDHIMAHLIQENFLNEERFARAFARGKFKIKKWGKVRIIRELKQRQISSVNQKLALQEIDDGEYLETFNTLVSKKLEQIQDLDKTTTKRKLRDYLLYRGWESHLVYEKINTLHI